MKVFLDTNVLVSAFISRGLCSDLLEIILTEHQLMTGEFVLQEFDRVLISKLKVPKISVLETVSFLRKFHVEPIPDKPSEELIRDQDDRWILESALRAKADMLVTGDKDLLEISDKINQLKIISPREFWEMVKM